jgi:nucleoside triphosphate diphosphatase
MSSQAAIERLLAVMARLRDPETGCPWDVQQDFATIAPYTIEEAYEVADAIARQDLGALREELGDLLFQVVFHARMAEEKGAFAFQDVASALADKMIARHPHVFADAERQDVARQTASWEAIKADERARKKAASTAPASALDDVPLNLPALARAQKIQKRAGRVGFDWRDPVPALDKVVEETAEVRAALAVAAARPEELAEELGDLLFAVVNVARLAGVDAETALRNATIKFERRFRGVEAELMRRGRTPETSDLAEMDAIWDAVKKAERGAG